MTGNISYLTDFKEFDGGYVAFGGGAKGGKITGKRTIRTADESHVLLKVLRKNNMYSVDMKNIFPKNDLTCLVFFFATKDETRRILKSFITKIESLEDKKVKIIRRDNGTEFKNRFMNEFCEAKGTKREYSVARTPQQNRIAERRNRTLIEAARTISNINTASPTVNTVKQSDDFFGADNDMRSLDGVEVDISNISATYPVPTTPNTRIHTDHSLDNVIGDIHSGVQIRRMTATTNEQGFISAIYEEKTHKDL
nr:putative ribonuclease H-like domain-containing protein [Tanacetum cinerariifolium]GEZ05584.1 putative ribonuclease H-like domain-containing protein [Tanacetum cinerariifolium]GEZ05599.1 putative ribonuclease H-like domain-containing protein [Tanacetum cinerariifolium]